MQGAYDWRDYDDRLDNSGYARDSDGYTLAAGLRGKVGAQFTGEIFAGWMHQNYRDPRLRDVDTFDVGATLDWRDEAGRGGSLRIGASDALLHVHAGMAVLLLARVVTGRSLATPVPFAIVCLAELANEVLDRVNHGSWRRGDTSLDVLNTLFWPFVLMVGLRIRRSREGRRGSPPRERVRGATI